MLVIMMMDMYGVRGVFEEKKLNGCERFDVCMEIRIK